jgi:hypothetical protein
MAKMFYTLDETRTALGRNEEEIKQFAREGRLREFRDGPRLMFKADQVEQLKQELGGGGPEISLSPASDSGAPIGLADSRGGSSLGGSGISLADSTAGRALTKDDTQQFGEVNLAGSFGGVPSPAKGDSRAADSRAGGSSGGSLSGLSASGLTTAGTRGGITVFDVEEGQRADPSAQTSVSSVPGDQVSLESIGSGSGLLDLTRESDDTSLGAVFDEIAPGGAPAAAPRRPTAVSPVASMETQAGSDVMAAIDTRRPAAPTVYVEATDPVAVGLGAASLAATIVVCFAMFILGAVLIGYNPEILKTVRDNGLIMLLGAFGVIAIFFVVGLVLGRSAASRA